MGRRTNKFEKAWYRL